uniref:Peptidase C14 caspase domain-containing protein n=1 Tax=Eutreptiella gymnastica TaxID=73025 RepID=A0A7S1JFA8_9EUGL
MAFHCTGQVGSGLRSCPLLKGNGQVCREPVAEGQIYCLPHALKLGDAICPGGAVIQMNMRMDTRPMPELSLYSREWICQGCGESRHVQGSELTPPVRPCKACGPSYESDWVCAEIDFKAQTRNGAGAASVKAGAQQAYHRIKAAPVPKGFLAPAGNMKALLIGLNYKGKGDELELSRSVDDITTIVEFLETQGWQTDDNHMKIMTDDGIGVNPTRDNVIEALNWFVGDAEPGDSLFMQFSGQGVLEEGCVLTAELDVVLEEEVFDIVANRLPPGVRLTVLADCCQPMTILQMPKNYYNDGGLRSHSISPWYRPVEFPADIVVFSMYPAGRGAHVPPGNVMGGAVSNAFMAMLLEAGTDITYHDLLIGMEEKIMNGGVRAVEVQIGVMCPRRFDPYKKLSLIATEDPLVPLSERAHASLTEAVRSMPAPLVAFNLEPDVCSQAQNDYYDEGCGNHSSTPVVPPYRTEDDGVISRGADQQKPVRGRKGELEPLGGYTVAPMEHGVNCKKDCCKIFNTYNAVRAATHVNHPELFENRDRLKHDNFPALWATRAPAQHAPKGLVIEHGTAYSVTTKA